MSDVKTAIAMPTPSVPGETVGTPCLIVYYGRQLGRRYLLDQPTLVMGRADTVAIQIDEDWASREHARLTVRGQACLLTDLGSTNGTWVNGRRVDSADLCDGDLVRIGQTIFKYLSGANIEAKYHEAIYRLTTTDGLTGAVNKRAFLDVLDREIVRARHDAVCLALAFLDIDFFKRVNDTLGHLAGDYALRELSRIVAGRVRPVDTFARCGGEEFAVILPGMTRDAAGGWSEELRSEVHAFPFAFDDHAFALTVSIGVTTLDFSPRGTATPADDPATMMARADERLYASKHGGRDRVSV